LLLPQILPGILGRRALPARRLTRLGATPGFHQGLLAARQGSRVARVTSHRWTASPAAVPERKNLHAIGIGHDAVIQVVANAGEVQPANAGEGNVAGERANSRLHGHQPGGTFEFLSNRARCRRTREITMLGLTTGVPGQLRSPRKRPGKSTRTRHYPRRGTGWSLYRAANSNTAVMSSGSRSG
jgi:hypothetical protein